MRSILLSFLCAITIVTTQFCMNNDTIANLNHEAHQKWIDELKNKAWQECIENFRKNLKESPFNDLSLSQFINYLQWNKEYVQENNPHVKKFIEEYIEKHYKEGKEQFVEAYIQKYKANPF